MRWAPGAYGGLLLLAAAILLFGAAIICVTIEAQQAVFPVTTGLVLGALGLAVLRRSLVRVRGVSVERRARSSVRWPESWAIVNNRLLAGGGDIDIFVTSPNQERFAIEIKSYSGAIVRRSTWRSSAQLVRLNGKPFAQDPVAQVERAAAELRATPVIWFPAARCASTTRMRSGVIVVQGGAHHLVRAIGARRVW